MSESLENLADKRALKPAAIALLMRSAKMGFFTVMTKQRRSENSALVSRKLVKPCSNGNGNWVLTESGESLVDSIIKLTIEEVKNPDK